MKLFERRRQQAQLVVIGALIGQGELTTTQLTQRTGLTFGRLHVALAGLEGAGRVSSRWQDGPHPRRRHYRYAFATGGIDQEWRITGQPAEGDRVDITWHWYEGDPEQRARAFAAWARAQGWTDGPHLHWRTVTVTDWTEVDA